MVISMYYMDLAILASACSIDPNRKVGAVIVNRDTGKVLSVHHNRMPDPIDVKSSYEVENKNDFIVHAELGALMNLDANMRSDTAMFVTDQPCDHCAKHIAWVGISEVHWIKRQQSSPSKWAEAWKKAEEIFEKSGVVFYEWERSKNEYVLLRTNEKRLA